MTLEFTSVTIMSQGWASISHQDAKTDGASIGCSRITLNLKK